MKNILLVFILFMSSSDCFSQDKKSFYFDEISIGVNKSLIEYEHYNALESISTNKLGLGIEVYKVGFKYRLINIVSGFEYNFINYSLQTKYNQTFYYKYKLYKFEGYSEYFTHLISTPILLRINLVRSKKAYVEGGGIVDFMNLTHRKSITTYTIQKYSEIDNEHPEQFDYSSEIFKTTFTFGWKVGLGFTIPTLNNNIFLKMSIQKRYPYAGVSLCCKKINLNTIKLSIGLKI